MHSLVFSSILLHFSAEICTMYSTGCLALRPQTQVQWPSEKSHVSTESKTWRHEVRLLKMMFLKKISPLSDTETADDQCRSCGRADGWVFTSPLFSSIFGPILCPSRKYLTVRIIFTFWADHCFPQSKKILLLTPRCFAFFKSNLNHCYAHYSLSPPCKVWISFEISSNIWEKWVPEFTRFHMTSLLFYRLLWK